MPKEVKQVLFNAFGTPVAVLAARQDCYKFDGIGERMLPQFGLELDKETGSTIIVQKDPIDLHELTQSYKDQCGMELAQKLISRGLATEDDFAAQPIDYGDSSQLADNINDAYQQAMANQGKGIDLGQFKTAQDIDNYIIEQVKQQIAKAQANQTQTQPQTNNDGGNK